MTGVGCLSGLLFEKENPGFIHPETNISICPIGREKTTNRVEITIR